MDVWRSIGLSYSWLSASPRSTCMSPWRLICDCDISSPHQWNRYMLLHAVSCSQTCTRLTWVFKFISAPAPMSLSTTSPWPLDDAQWSGDHPIFRNEGEVAIKTPCSSWIKFHGCSWWEHTKTTDTLALQRWNAQTTHLLRLKESLCLDFIYFMLNPDAKSHFFSICLPLIVHRKIANAHHYFQTPWKIADMLLASSPPFICCLAFTDYNYDMPSKKDFVLHVPEFEMVERSKATKRPMD